MPKLKYKTLLLLLFLCLASVACRREDKQSESFKTATVGKSALTKEQLFGVWLKKIAGQKGFEGYQFEAEGKVRFVNMFTIVGDKWELLAGDSLRIWAYSGRIPEAVAVTYFIAALQGDSLALIPQGATAGFKLVYHRPKITRKTDHWIGRWTGPEGLFLDITPEGENYRLVINTLDAMAVYPGHAEDESIRFEREGKTEYLRAGSGADTGLKWLADKQLCLVIKAGEGFCR